MMTPVQVYLTRGVGVHREELVAFELALRDAGVAAQNLVTVSSILPPRCEIVDRADGEKLLEPGQILHVVLSREETNDPHARVGASIGIARPVDRSHHGFIAEHGSFSLGEAEIAAHAEDLAVSMLASTLGIEVDESMDAAARARAIGADGGIEQSGAICSVAGGDPEGRWTCVVAVAVLIMEWMLPGEA